MDSEKVLRRYCGTTLRRLCEEIDTRSVGSEGNRVATRYLRDELLAAGWQVEAEEFAALDWAEEGARLTATGLELALDPSPYSLGCDVTGGLVRATTVQELEALDYEGKILLLEGPIAAEQLMPKGFVFYNPPEHRRIVHSLEAGGAAALITATGHDAALAGGLSPFPLIEDGDFDLPSVYLADHRACDLYPLIGREVRLESRARRIPATGYNLAATRGTSTGGRIVISAHVDAKRGSPGALDNASGVAVLMIVAHLLQGYRGPRAVELVAFNGEDYYSAPGQMRYIASHHDDFEDVVVNINIDGAGYRSGGSALSFFGLPPALRSRVLRLMTEFPDLVEGEPWPQGDHSIFVQHHRPAIAVTSQWFLENIETQTITHTPRDRPELIECNRLTDLARLIARIATEG